ncbi:putative nuclease HARBI1 [Leptopilina heterotoma]|uniref:putative nuclease HARBI1 n=1 Tax=Leptopilina heterotoma TaxID=63436 RepID=UPI001CA9C0C8|nr:putative nuclease HARBI1 [Leptopilina heterotoma]XP_043478350.1 putative nuclease HARBI1 [Leptopilina heterotoma]
MDLKIQLRIIQLLIIKYNKKETVSWRRELLRSKIISLWKLYLIRKQIVRREEQVSVQRRFWVRPIFTVDKRIEQGFSNNLIKEMLSNDHEKYFTFFRVVPAVFDQLYERIGPLIEKATVFREPISAKTRLEITLRFLASGDSMVSLSYAFRVAHNTISKIISETCQKIYECLKDDYLLKPSEQNWKDIIEDFKTIWNFDHCMGAIDGKQVQIRAPYNTGSLYYNYKHDFAINLMAICDAKARFLIVDVGGEGRRSDSGVLRSSEFFKRLINNNLHIPPAEPLGENGPIAPNVFVADEGLCGFTSVLTPYARSGDLNNMMKVFNYRLSRARRIVECAFGILVARWRVFARKIIASVSTTKKIILAAIVLHNFILSLEENEPENRRPYQTLSEEDRQLSADALIEIPMENGLIDQNDPSIARETFAQYFYNEGAVEWQWEKVLQNNF